MDETKPNEPGAAAEPKPKPAPVPVTVLGVQGQSALVEWADGGLPRRAYIPASAVKDGRASPVTLGRGVGYGAPWERLDHPRAGQLATALRNRGVWTYEDLRTNPNAAIGALQAIWRLDLAALLAFAKENE